MSDTVKFSSMNKKVHKVRLRWFGHVMRTEEKCWERQIMNKEVVDRMKRRIKTRWRCCFVADRKEMNLDIRIVKNKIKWKRDTLKAANPHKSEIITLQKIKIFVSIFPVFLYVNRFYFLHKNVDA